VGADVNPKVVGRRLGHASIGFAFPLNADSTPVARVLHAPSATGKTQQSTTTSPKRQKTLEDDADAAGGGQCGAGVVSSSSWATSASAGFAPSLAKISYACS